ncbi:MAG: hypothetical protein ACOZBH_04200 [Patescibacteria group bacterium]
MKKLALAQFIVLILGTVFAWINFVYEFIQWRRSGSCAACVIGEIKNPFLSPCFYGAIFFTIAAVLSGLMVKRSE